MKKSLIVGSFLALTALAACNGSTTTGSAPPTVVTPTPIATASPAPASSSVSLQSGIQSAGSQVTVPAVGGISALLTLPGFNNSLSGSPVLTSSVGAPPSTNVPVTFASFKRTTLSTRHALSGTNVPIFFLLVQPPVGTGQVTFSGTFTAAFTIPTSAYPSGSNLYLAAYYPGASSWVDAVAGPATVSGTTATFTATTTFTLAAGQTYALAVYYTSSSQTAATLPCGVTGSTPTGITVSGGTAASSGSSPLVVPGSGTLGYNVTPSASGTLSVIPFTASTLSSTTCATNSGLVNVYGGLAVNPSTNESFVSASLTYTNTSPSPAFNVSGTGLHQVQLWLLNATNPSAGWVNLTSLATFGPVTGGGTILPITVPTANLSGASLLGGNQYLFVLGTN